MKRVLLGITAIAAFISVYASEPEPRQAETGCEESVTIFQDVSMIGRKNRLASNITDRHREMNAKGWHFVDMEIYVENADIEGAFLSYSRPVPCTDTQER